MVCRLAALGLLSIYICAAPAFAEVCVWRNPERTMTRLYPAAQDYRTVTTKISAEALRQIEERLGAPLSEGESKAFAAYAITDSAGAFLGWVAADAEPGEYGVIEMVAGARNGRIVGLYIQRSRERASRAIQSRTFLDQFRGRGLRDLKSSCGSSIFCQLSGPDILPVDASPRASEAVAFGVKKILVLLEILNPSPIGRKEKIK